MKQIPKLVLNAEHELQQRKLIEQQFDDAILKASDEYYKHQNKAKPIDSADAKIYDIATNQLLFNKNRLIRTKNNWIKNGRKLFYQLKKDIVK